MQFGSDYSCGVDYGTIRGGTTTCPTANGGNGIYVPGFYLRGAATAPTCAPSNPVVGALTPTGARTLCCLP